MTPVELAVRYRKYAIRCWLFARQVDNASDRAMLIDMAQAWASLANCAAKNEALFAYEASAPEWRH
jgi:hypothetical protein